MQPGLILVHPVIGFQVAWVTRYESYWPSTDSFVTVGIENIGYDPAGNRMGRRKEKVINDSSSRIAHRHRIWNMFKVCSAPESLLKSLGYNVVWLLLFVTEKITFAGIARLLPGLVAPKSRQPLGLLWTNPRSIAPKHVAVHIGNREVEKNLKRVHLASGVDYFPLQMQTVRVKQA